MSYILQNAVNMGVKEEDAEYVLSLNPKVKEAALKIMEKELDNHFGLSHSGTHPKHLFGHETYSNVNDERLMQIIADYFNIELDTAVNKFHREELRATSPIRKNLFRLLSFLTITNVSNATRRLGLKELLRSSLNEKVSD